MKKEEYLRHLIISGIDMLQEEQNYKQNQIINKLKTLNITISAASFSNILTKSGGSRDLLQITAIGIQEIIKTELGYTHNGSVFEKNIDQSFKPIFIKETKSSQTRLENDSIMPGFTFHTEGRVKIQDKTNFLQNAQFDIIEVGTRLRTFTDYFFSRNEQEFKIHIVNLLKQGVKMRFYMLDPESNVAGLYFEDRAKVQDEEKFSIEDMRKVISRLKKIHAELTEEVPSASFEVYLYRHIPTNHFLVVDGMRPNGKMMVSYYLYGIKRAECPVIEIDKQLQPQLFKKYYKSLQSFIKDAKLSIPVSLKTTQKEL